MKKASHLEKDAGLFCEDFEALFAYSLISIPYSPPFSIRLDQQVLQYLFGRIVHHTVLAVAVRVHRHHRREVLDFDDPERFRDTEVQFVDIQHFFDRLGNKRSRAADGVQVNAGRLLAAFERFCAHAALADDTLQVKVLHHIGLVGFLADGCGRPGGDKFVVFL
jgi:hypothetical protein